MALDLHTTKQFIDALQLYPATELSRHEIANVALHVELPFPRWYCNIEDFRIEHGVYRKATYEECLKLDIGYTIPGTRNRSGRSVGDNASEETQLQESPSAISTPQESVKVHLTSDDIAKLTKEAIGNNEFGMVSDTEPNIPEQIPGYVPTGHYTTISKILDSSIFLPFMVTGPSGNGKTEMIAQICAEKKRILIRTNITNQTDEDDLVGGFRLLKGETKFNLGPVPMAMITGAVLLLDEIDLGTAPLMCLQPVLEGKPLYIKKIGKYIYPRAGFTIAATLNTKGLGDDGRYAHTNIMNEAMLERFALMFQQQWPEPAVERKIIGYVMRQFGKYDAELCSNLVSFANATRKNYMNQQFTSQIATRRLLHIVKSYCTLGDINRVMELTLARFDDADATGMMAAWKAINDKATSSSSGGKIG